MIHLAFNFVIAVCWVFLLAKPSFDDFVIGWIIGYVLLSICQPLLRVKSQYFRRTNALFRFIFQFIKLFIQSNYTIARAVVFRPVEEIKPNFIEYDTDGMSFPEIFLLTHCITLTPGTTSAYVDPDLKKIVVHAFDGEDPEAVRQDIKRNLESYILAFTR